MSEYKIVVFDDGETWAYLESTQVYTLNEEQHEQLENGVYPRHLKGLRQIHTLPLSELKTCATCGAPHFSKYTGTHLVCSPACAVPSKNEGRKLLSSGKHEED